VDTPLNDSANAGLFRKLVEASLRLFPEPPQLLAKNPQFLQDRVYLLQLLVQQSENVDTGSLLLLVKRQDLPYLV
jgi:hypothetical protein